jgi:serine/threonine-protein kinase HipA
MMEDFCQALGYYPAQKYESDGGPSAAKVAGALRTFSDAPEEDVDRLIQLLAFNWVIAGTDCHAKNVSLLHGPGSFTRLAPAYDLASWLPYEKDPCSTKIKLAMKIGGTYRLNQIDARRWDKWAAEVEIAPDRVRAGAFVIARRIAEAVAAISIETTAGAETEFIARLRALLSKRAKACAARF